MYSGRKILHVYGSSQCSLSIGEAIQMQEKSLSVTQMTLMDWLRF